MSKVLATSAAVLQQADRTEWLIQRTLQQAESAAAVEWLEEKFAEGEWAVQEWMDDVNERRRANGDKLLEEARGAIHQAFHFEAVHGAGSWDEDDLDVPVCVRPAMELHEWEYDHRCDAVLNDQVFNLPCEIDGWVNHEAAQWPTPIICHDLDSPRD